MKKAFSYANCHIVVRTTERAGAGYCWEYTIDGEHPGTSGGYFVPTEERAVAQAFKVAKLQIDCWREPYTVAGPVTSGTSHGINPE